MADFRRWILALAVVALLAGLSVPAGAQPLNCQSSVTTTPIVRAEGLAELVGDLLVTCTGGTPTAAGLPVPQYTITVFLNTNITSKVLGTQLASFGNGQTSALDEALLLIDEPNSTSSPGVVCATGGSSAGKCTGGLIATALAYPILNCGAVVNGAPAAPDGSSSGPGVCEIIATPFPEHTYDGTVAGSTNIMGPVAVPDACLVGSTVITQGTSTVTATTTTGSPTITLSSIGSTLWAGSTIKGTGIPAATTVLSVTNGGTTLVMSANATASNTTSVTITGNLQGATATGSNSLGLDFASGFSSTPAPAGTTYSLTSLVGGTITDGGAALPPNTVILAVSGQQLTLSNAETATVAGDTFSISFVATTGTIGTLGSTGAPGYSCGRPNVFQGRIGALQNPNQYNAVTFVGVPLDPPGTAFTRTLRITNIRANAAQLGISSTFTTSQILMNVAINNGPVAGWNIGNPQQIVAYVNKGLNPVPAFAPASNQYYTNISSGQGTNTSLPGGSTLSGLAGSVPVIGEFVQCISQNPDLFSATPAPTFQVPGYMGNSPINDTVSKFIGGFDCNGPGGDCQVGGVGVTANVTPTIRFYEVFASSWKYKNISFAIGDGAATPTTGNATFGTGGTVNGFTCLNGDYCYNGKRNHPLDVPQNVPGSSYNTETGFSYPAQGVTLTSAGPPPSPLNPPKGFGTAAPGSSTNGNPFTDDWLGTANATGIGTAGQASQGTRLYLSFASIPSGSSLYVPPVIYLFRQGVQHNGDPATLGPNPMTGQAQSQTTGVMVLVTTDANGNNVGPYLAAGSPLSPFGLQKIGATGLAVYEILYTDPYSTEYADVPVVVAYASNPAQNLPDPTATTQVTGGFAPFYTNAASTQPSPNASYQSPTLPVPRFIPGTAFNFLNIQKCACDILFPFVANVGGYDTGIVVSNTSLDPGATFGFKGVAQPGTVQFWYYGTMSSGAAVPGPQTSTVIQPGNILTYVLSTGGTGLDGRAAGFEGYLIAQAQFQYCHGFAYVSAQGAGPTSPGISEGYLGIILDSPGLQRTSSIGENDAH